MSTTELERAMQALVESEKAQADAKVAARRARVQLETAVMVDTAEQRASAVDEKLLDGDFQHHMWQIAKGKRWYDSGEFPMMNHQWDGAVFGAGAERFILGDGMGLGKTRTSIGWLDLVGARKVIVVCLAEVASQFAGEMEELAPHRHVSLLTGRTPLARERELEVLEAAAEGTLIVNFELFNRTNGLLQRLGRWGADTVIVDEAHTLKARGARKNLEQLVLGENAADESVSAYPLDRYLAKRSVKNLALVTGTPILNDPTDIFPLLHLIDPLLFKSLASFNRAYTVMNYASNRLEFKPGGLFRLKQLLAGFYIARTYEDAGIVLPKNTHRVVSVPILAAEYPDQRRIIDEITNSAQITLASGERHDIMHLMSVLLRRRQANVWAAGIVIRDVDGNVLFDVGQDVDESAKMDTVIAEIERHAPQRQVVFSQFKTALAELERRLVRRGVRVVRLDGDTPARLRDEIKRDFYRPVGAPKWEVLLANYATGGVGLNVTRATVVHELDEQWNPGKRDQARARVARVGQTEETTVLTYRVPSSVDTYVANIIRQKERMVVGFKDAVLGEKTTIELLREAVAS